MMLNEDCENCKQLAEMYINDTEELRSEIRRLRKENQELKDGMVSNGIADLEQKIDNYKHQLRHI